MIGKMLEITAEIIFRYLKVWRVIKMPGILQISGISWVCLAIDLFLSDMGESAVGEFV